MPYPRKTTLKAAALLVAAFASGWPAAHADIIRLDPTPKTANVGDAFSLNLLGEGFADIVDGGGVNLSFDPAIVHVTGVTLDSGTWDFSTSVGAIDNTLGSVSDIWFNALQNVTGNFAIATIQFQAVGAGVSALTLSEATGNPFASGGDLLAVSFTNGSAQISGNAVPEPATWLLLLVGFGLSTHFHHQKEKSHANARI